MLTHAALLVTLESRLLDERIRQVWGLPANQGHFIHKTKSLAQSPKLPFLCDSGHGYVSAVCHLSFSPNLWSVSVCRCTHRESGSGRWPHTVYKAHDTQVLGPPCLSLRLACIVCIHSLQPPVTESKLRRDSSIASHQSCALHSLSATPGGPGLESGYQNLLRQHQPYGRPHLPAPDEGTPSVRLRRRNDSELTLPHTQPSETPAVKVTALPQCGVCSDSTCRSVLT